jgi:hypothetical protein
VGVDVASVHHLPSLMLPSMRPSFLSLMHPFFTLRLASRQQEREQHGACHRRPPLITLLFSLPRTTFESPFFTASKCVFSLFSLDLYVFSSSFCHIKMLRPNCRSYLFKRVPSQL